MGELKGIVRAQQDRRRRLREDYASEVDNAFKNINKEKIQHIRDILIKEVEAGLISHKYLEELIEEKDGTIFAGLLTSVRSITSKGFRDMTHANEIAFEQEYGFLAYKGEINNLGKKQGYFSQLNYAEGFRDGAGWDSTIGHAEGFREDAGSNANIEYAEGFGDWAGCEADIRYDSRKLTHRLLKKIGLK